ncbi:hypothetical protein NK718_12780 [Alsobacter sp. SYSU M60028]|uniref:Uncharacterized protein n=1 Tax=Alsobacter ponti TaxID=2962936 RepID=A0ABT1LD07_9HYPH|nr:hypothetical protein [Alsobacter ponti]MCP8939392.1 hypothetical protein [Alsobacter ponti]
MAQVNQALGIAAFSLSGDPKSPVGRLAAVYEKACAAALEARSKRSDLANSKELTEAGLQKRMAAYAREGAYAALLRLHHEFGRVKEIADEKRAAIAVPKPDPRDAAGAIAGMEIRTWLRSLGPAAAFSAAWDDPQIADIALGMPAAVSEIPPDMYEKLREKRLNELFGPKIAELAELDEAVTIAGQALAVATSAMADSVGAELGAITKEVGIPVNEEQEKLSLAERHERYLAAHPDAAPDLAKFKQAMTLLTYDQRDELGKFAQLKNQEVWLQGRGIPFRHVDATLEYQLEGKWHRF